MLLRTVKCRASRPVPPGSTTRPWSSAVAPDRARGSASEPSARPRSIASGTAAVVGAVSPVKYLPRPTRPAGRRPHR
ncbi:hypothetical protein ACFQ0T_00590 [Kitasatospora gansuensis]